jgi:crotonobetainyl-CoA:carnitine CoA-transferase CaiB-like acyl-CoA transferase
VENRQLVTDTLSPVMQARTTAEWVEALEALKIGCGPDQQALRGLRRTRMCRRALRVQMPHASGQTVKVIANPVRLSATPTDYRVPPPVLVSTPATCCRACSA